MLGNRLSAHFPMSVLPPIECHDRTLAGNASICGRQPHLWFPCHEPEVFVMLVSIDKWGRIARGGPASLVICGGKNQTQSPTRMLTSASHGPAKCLVNGFSQANSLCNEIILILLCIEYDETSWPCAAARSLGGHGPPPARWA